MLIIQIEERLLRKVMTKITELSNQLGEILLPRGYKKAGKIFYRVQGDGVIIFLGFDYERTVYGHRLQFGISSLYREKLHNPKDLAFFGCVLPESEHKKLSWDSWFSSSEPLKTLPSEETRASVMKWIYGGADIMNQRRNNYELEYLIQSGFLDQMESIINFEQAFSFLIEKENRDNRWTEYYYYGFFFELLSLGRYEDAIKVFYIREKLDYWGSYYTVLKTDFIDYERRWYDLEAKFVSHRKFVRLLEANKTEEVQERLREIYAHNLATFGVRKKRGKTSPKEK